MQFLARSAGVGVPLAVVVFLASPTAHAQCGNFVCDGSENHCTCETDCPLAFGHGCCTTMEGSGFAENCNNSPADCPCPPGQTCVQDAARPVLWYCSGCGPNGNEPSCGPGEDPCNCPADCSTPTCGDDCCSGLNVASSA